MCPEGSPRETSRRETRFNHINLMPREIELKLALPPHSFNHFRDMSWLRSRSIVASTTIKLYSIYYDTPDLRLKNLGCSFRLRKTGKDWVQTIKAGGSILAGLHQHDEWEMPIPNAQPNFTLFKDPKMQQLFKDPKLIEALQPVFITKFTRHLQYLKLNHGSEIEFCLDHGKIIAGQKRTTICEIELELKAGDPLELLKFAYKLVDKSPFPLRLENASKAERGYTLHSGHAPPPVKAIKTEIASNTSLNTALKMIMENCLDQLSKNENGMLMAHEDIEYLHQMRVALRRLRSAVNIFHQAFPSTEVLSIRKDLKWLANQLNPARDWDIFVTETIPCIAGHFPQHTGLFLVLDTSKTIRKKYNEVAHISIKSRRYTRLMLNISIWLTSIDQSEEVETKAQAHNASQPTDTRTFITTLMAELYQKILETGKNPSKLDAPTLHTLRIYIKKQRYISEFFQAFYPSRAYKQYIDLLAYLQDLLGSINDYANAQKFLDETHIKKNKNVQYEAIAVIHGWITHSLVEKKIELSQAWMTFSRAESFWDGNA